MDLGKLKDARITARLYISIIFGVCLNYFGKGLIHNAHAIYVGVLIGFFIPGCVEVR